MSTRTANRRRQRRYPVPKDREAVVEFEHPTPNGRHYRFHLATVSSSGISFNVVADEVPPLEIGANLPGVVIRISDCMIHGDLVVMHVTREPSGEPVCGALLYPATDTDLLKLKSVVAGMQAVTT